jgi:hypothetical protein
LQQAFILSFILLAPFVGAFADSLPKGRVMFISNAIKMAGCLAMLAGVNPLLAYGLAARRGRLFPAKYGILTEYLPPTLVRQQLAEGLTVAAIMPARWKRHAHQPKVVAPLLQCWTSAGRHRGTGHRLHR